MGSTSVVETMSTSVDHRYGLMMIEHVVLTVRERDSAPVRVKDNSTRIDRYG